MPSDYAFPRAKLLLLVLFFLASNDFYDKIFYNRKLGGLFLICIPIITHSAYKWNIKCQKCAGMGLNGFILKKINEN